ncbi:MAG: retropepsin-like aspartic protease [Planctomycetaceae bacterium]
METETMGRVVTQATVENLQDLWDVDRGMLRPDEIRSIAVDDALVDTGATTLALPTRFIERLGLRKTYEKQATSSQGVALVNVYDAVRLTIGDRFCTVDVIEIPDDVPVLIGQIPLEMLDYVVDLQSRKLIGNPAHGGEQMLELY